ncbi:MAG: ribose-phosphate diphosphokinase [Thermoproteota archaeon]|nr:ribose-phosphate diphosphokinase [Thermoproteota archaeon]
MPGPASLELGNFIASRLKSISIPIDLRVFSDGESKICINANTRLLNKKCIVVQSTYPPVDSNMMQTLMIVSGCYESGASEVITVIPYMGYARQDRKFLEGEFVTISLIARLLECINVCNLITVDIHSNKALSYFNLNISNISSVNSLASYARTKFNLVNPIVVSPDIGGISRAKEFSEIMHSNFFALKKIRDRVTGNVVMDENLQVDIKDRDIIIIDDMISSGETILKALDLLKKNKCGKIYAMCVHALCDENSIKKLKNAGLTDLVSTNSVPRSSSKVDLSMNITNALSSIIC